MSVEEQAAREYSTKSSSGDSLPGAGSCRPVAWLSQRRGAAANTARGASRTLAEENVSDFAFELMQGRAGGPAHGLAVTPFAGYTEPVNPSVTELVAAIAQAAASTPDLLVAFLFGSQLSGRTWAESDVDVGVRWSPGLDLPARVQAERRFADQLAALLPSAAERIDLVDLDRSVSSVAFRAIRDGVCAWAESERERIAAVVRVARRYDDEASLRELFREAARASVDQLARDAHG